MLPKSVGALAAILFFATFWPVSNAIAQVVQLSDAGVTFYGDDSSDESGAWVANAGDVDGDGFGDFVIGAPLANSLSRTDNGTAYLVYGSASLTDPFDFDSPPANGVTQIHGAGSSHQAGYRAAAIGDFNQDGLDDFAISAPFASYSGRSGAGRIYIIFGSATRVASIDLKLFTSAEGVLVGGPTSNDKLGTGLSGAGDFNDDGIPDVVIGASNALGGKGAAYVVYGDATPPAEIDTFDDLDGGAGVVFKGDNDGDKAGSAVAGLGDVNGDGVDDIGITAPEADPNGNKSGIAYIIYGEAAPPDQFSLCELFDVIGGGDDDDDDDDDACSGGGGGGGGALSGLVVKGGFVNDNLGNAIAGGNDTDGDGFCDVLIAAKDVARSGHSGVGEVYLLFGDGALPAVISAGSFSAYGISFRGNTQNDKLGHSVAALGDVDNDGFDDILLGAIGYDPTGRSGAGAAYLIAGGQAFPALVSGTDLVLFSVIHEGVAAGDCAGWSVSGAGDVNGDGAPDYLVGARLADPSGRSSGGESYLFFGAGIAPVEDLTCEVDGTTIIFNWTNGEPDYEEIKIIVDGETIATLPGDATSYVYRRIDAGPHNICVRGLIDDTLSPPGFCNVNVVVMPPVDFECSSDGTLVHLSWTNGQTYSTAVEVLRDGIVIATLAGTAGSYSEPMPEPGTYEYCVRGVNGGDASTSACCELAIPLPVEDLLCAVDGDAVTLSWTVSDAYTAIEISRDGSVIVTLPGGATSFTDLGVPVGSHTFSVVGLIGDGESVAVTCDVTIVAPVTDLACSSEGDSVHLSWVNGGVYTAIHIVRSGTEIAVIAGSSTSYDDTGLGPGEYTYEVIADSAGALAAAATCEVSVLDPVHDLECFAEGGDVFLTWTNGDNPFDYTSIKILRNGTEIASLSGVATSYFDLGVPAGTYTYEVIGVKTSSVSTAATCTIDVLDPLGSFSCSAKGTSITLSWTNGSTYTSIEIYRDGGLLVSLPGTARAYKDKAPIGTHSYEAFGTSGGSTSLSVFCEVATAGAPFDLLCEVTGATATVSWTNGDLYDSIKILLNGDVVQVLGAVESTFVALPGAGVHTICVVGTIGASDSAPACCIVSMAEPPSDFECIACGDDVILTWINNGVYDAIKIFRDDVLIATIPCETESYTDTGLAPGFYTYELVAVISGSETAPATCSVSVLPPISLVSCSADDGTVSIAWTNGTIYDLIRVYRNDLLIAELPGDATSLEDPGISAGVYVYEVIGHAGASKTDPAACLATIPMQPFGLDCTLEDGVTVHLNWSNTQIGDALEVYRDGILIAILPPTTTTYADGPILPGVYEYCVVNVIGEFRSVHSCCEVIVPAAPSEFVCEAVLGGVELAWINNESYGSLLITRNGLLIAVVPGTLTSYLDPNVPSGAYDYGITGFVSGFESAEASCMVTVPPAVLDLECFFNESSVTLSWTLPVDYDSILIYRNGALIGELPGTASTFIDTLVAAGVYEYGVVGIIDPNQSPVAECTVEVLERPVDLTCVGAATSATLAWTNAQLYDSIDVFRDGALIATLPGVAVSYTDTGLTPGEYDYCVRGVAADGTVSGHTCCTVAILEAPFDLLCTVDGSSVALAWTNGDSYDFITILRDGATIVTLPGSSTSFTQIGVPPGSHTYEVIGHVSVDFSASATCDVFVVAPIDELSCAADGDTATLTITAPGSTALRVYRDGVEIAVLAGGSQVFVDPTPLAAGLYVYEVRAEELGSLSDAVSCTVVILIGISNFECSAVGGDVFLNWTNGQIYGAIQLFRDGTLIAILPGTTTAYVDMVPVVTATLVYEVVPESGSSIGDPVACSVCIVEAVLDLICSVSGTDITLSWTLVGTYDVIEIYRNGSLLATLAGSETSFTHSAPAASYEFEVVAKKATSRSLAATCEVVAPGAPFGIDCSAAGDTASVSWTNGGVYDAIEIHVDGVHSQTLAGGATSTTIAGLAAGSHTICVYGSTGAGLSSPACCDLTIPIAIDQGTFTCEAAGDSVTLSWTNGEVYASIAILRDDVLIVTIPGNLQGYVDTSVPPGTHTYELNGTLGGGSFFDVFCTVTVLGGFGDLDCSASQSDFTVLFTTVPAGLDSILVERNGLLVATLPGSATSFSEPSLGPGVYVYEVSGVDGASTTDPVTCTLVVPFAPFNLVCSVTGGDDVQLNWSNAQAGDSISIFRNGVQIASLAGSPNTFTDLNVTAGSHQYCVVNVVDGIESAAVCCNVTIVLPVLDLECVATEDGVLITWTNGQVYDSVSISRDGVPLVEILGATGSYLDDGVAPGTYSYGVSGFADGSLSTEVTCAVTVPEAVFNIACEYDGTDIVVSWQISMVYSSITVYRNNTLIATLAGNATSYTDSTLPAGTYEYEVRGEVGGNVSPTTSCTIEILISVVGIDCCIEGDDVTICWTNLMTYDEIEIHRNGVLVAILAGDAECFLETVTGNGPSLYEVIGMSGGSSAAAVSCTVDPLLPILDLECVLEQETCATSDVTLTWSNPDTYHLIEVYRDGVLIGSVGGNVSSFFDEEAAGTQTYTVIGVLVGALCSESAPAICQVSLSQNEFLRADANNDGIVNIADPVWTLNYLFQDGAMSPCLDAGDANDDGKINIADTIYTLSFIFQNGPEPPEPYPDAGLDPTCDALDCAVGSGD